MNILGSSNLHSRPSIVKATIGELKEITDTDSLSVESGMRGIYPVDSIKVFFQNSQITKHDRHLKKIGGYNSCDYDYDNQDEDTCLNGRVIF